MATTFPPARRRRRRPRWLSSLLAVSGVTVGLVAVTAMSPAGMMTPNQPGVVVQAITFVQDTVNEPGSQASPQSFAITPAGVGNYQVLLYVARNSTNAVITSVTGAGADGSGWARVAGPLANDNGVYGPEEAWASRVGSTASTTITVNWSGSFTGGTFAVMEFSSPKGSATTWTVVANDTTFALTSATTIAFPTLVSVLAGEGYLGIQYSNTGTGGAAPAGFTIITTPAAARNITRNLSLAAATSYSPTGTQTGAGVGVSSVAIIFRAT